MKSRPNLLTRIETGMQRFAERMAASAPLEDATLTVRIVGEFSAGKTRLLRELLGDLVPDALAPISSRDAQTRLPLEVTYGSATRLSVVQRTRDTDQGSELTVLDRFPTRERIDGLGYRAGQHRLRLSLPLEQLVLPKGDGYRDDGPPSRMFLIDMPGWNSGDDAIAEEDAGIVLDADYSLSLIYVTQAGRLDSVTNRQRLGNFLEALGDALFLNGPRLMVVLTHCGAADAARLSARARELVNGIWAEAGNDVEDLALDILCADFNEMPDAERETFRQRFWQDLLKPLGQEKAGQTGHPWLDRIRDWPAEYDLRPRLAQTHALVTGLRQLAARACHDGQFLPGMNMQRVVIFDDDEIPAKLRHAWQRQVGPGALDEAESIFASLRLDAGHPLSDWWNEVWLDQARLLLAAVRTFVMQARAALDRVNRETMDLEACLRRHLEKPYARMHAALSSSFARQVDTARALVDQPLSTAIPTLLVLSAMQGHYEKQYAAHLQCLRRDEAHEA